MKIVLGVCGGIAAYKSALLLRLLTEAGHSVRVVPTPASLNFVGAATWEALSHHPVSTGVFEGVDEVQHVRLGQEADLVIVAPATADAMARIANGRADDLLTSTILATRAPVVLAPAMHTEMWENAATRANVELLRSRGMTVIEPAVGRLTGTDTGAGRLPDPEAIRDAALAAAGKSPNPSGVTAAAGASAGADDAAAASPWRSKRVVVSLGGTREALDPVRYLGNRSSGKQGLAFAEALKARGAQVTVVAGVVDVHLPDDLDVIRVESAVEMERAIRQSLGMQAEGTATTAADVLVMAAAVADFRPREVAGHKIKKRDDGQDPVIELVRNPDIIAGIARDRRADSPMRLVAFAAETGDEHGTVLDYGRSKLERKGVDALCVNEVGSDRGFGTEDNAITVLFADGSAPEETRGPKIEIAARIVDVLGQRFFGQAAQSRA